MIAWAGAPWEPRAWQAAGLPVLLDALRAGRRPLVSATPGSGKSVFVAEVVHVARARAGDRAIVVSAPSVMLVEQLSATLAQRLGPGAVGRWYGRRKDGSAGVIVACNDSMGTLAAELASAGRRVALCVTDEAHRSEAATVLSAVEAMRPALLFGVTGTPFRSVKAESLRLFDCLPIRYTLDDAIRDCVLVPPRVVGWDGALDVPVDVACEAMIDAHAEGPGIISAASIDDADAYAERLRASGRRVEAVHSGVPAGERARRVEALRAGELSALVHVSMLAEGVDYPWLRWICLRRKVGASVRFVQEGLRVGRAHPGKVEGLILDPHCLFGRFGWTTPDRIGSALERAADAETAERPATTREPTEALAIALDVLVDALELVHGAMARAGLVEAREDVGADAGWRLAPVSAKQVEAVQRSSRLTRHMPPAAREPVRALCRVPWALTRGQASTLLDVLLGGARWARRKAGPDGEAFRLSWSPAVLRGVRLAVDDEARGVRLWGERVARREAVG